MYRLKDLSLLIKSTPKKIAKDIAIKHRKKLYCRYDAVWYQFNSINNIIVPHDIAYIYTKNNKKNYDLSKPISISNIDYSYLTATTHSNNRMQVSIANVVVLLGHYNHGKTTLLDKLSSSNYIDDEKHKITQVIRTNLIALSSGKQLATIVDTPGQEIFYRMRSYGASIADAAILLVCGVEGIGQQTMESIGIIEQLQIPIVVCINKIDVLHDQHPPEVIETNLNNLESELREYRSLKQAPIVRISAKKGHNIDVMLESLKQLLDTERNNSNRNSQKEKVVPGGSDNSQSGSRLSISGHGTILNIEKTAKRGKMIQVVLRAGAVSTGDYFSAGGWGGKIRKMYTNVSSTVTSSEGPDFDVQPLSATETEVSSAVAGHAVVLLVSTFKTIDEPRPFGDAIRFHSDNLCEALKGCSGVIGNAKDGASYAMEQLQLPFQLPSYAISDESAARYRLPRLLSELTKSKRQYFLTPLELEQANAQQNNNSQLVEESEADYDSNNENELSDEEDDVPTFLVKADNDLSLATLFDHYSEHLEACDADAELSIPGNERGKEEVKIVYWGVGEILSKDIVIAHASKATIVAYNIGIQRDAARQAQDLGVRVINVDKMQSAAEELRIWRGSEQ